MEYNLSMGFTIGTPEGSPIAGLEDGGWCLDMDTGPPPESSIVSILSKLLSIPTEPSYPVSPAYMFPGE